MTGRGGGVGGMVMGVSLIVLWIVYVGIPWCLRSVRADLRKWKRNRAWERGAEARAAVEYVANEKRNEGKPQGWRR